MTDRNRQLWRCAECGRRFANRNQTHFCSQVPLREHFEGKPPETRRLYEAFLAIVRSHGPVKVLPEKTRIALQVRMSFAALMTRRGYLRGHLVLAQRQEHPCFLKVETFSPRNHLHAFELRHLDQLRDLGEFIGQAYRVGCQDHLKRASAGGSSGKSKSKMKSKSRKRSKRKSKRKSRMSFS